MNLLNAMDIFKMTPGRGILQDEKDRTTASLVFILGNGNNIQIIIEQLRHCLLLGKLLYVSSHIIPICA